MIVNEICGLGILEPLYRDKRVNEIIANGPFDIQVEIAGKVRRVPSCKFKDAAHLTDLIVRLYNSINKDFSQSNPNGNARLKDNSRIFATHTVMSPDGPNLNIRRKATKWINPQQMINWGSGTEDVFEWLGQHIDAGLSFVVNGGTATGKTTMLGALAGYFPNDLRILTIEKNIELILPKNKLLAAAMECIMPKMGSSFQGVSMRDLVVCCTQMRPDIVICGEIVGSEAYDLIQVANTGHQVCTTVHSNSSQDCIYRLMSLISQADLIKGKAALELIASGIDFIVSLVRFPQDGSRRIFDISEVGTEIKTNAEGQIYLPVYPIWQFIAHEENIDGHIKVDGHFKKVGELSIARQKKHGLQYRHLKTFSELQKMY